MKPKILNKINKLPKRKLILLIVLYLLLAHIFWYVAMSVYLGDFSINPSAYTTLAENLVNKGVYSIDGETFTAYRPPLYPFLIAVPIFLLGESYYLIGVLAIQILAGILIGIMVFLIAERIFRKKVIGLLAVLLCSFHGVLILENLRMRETALFILFTLLFVYVLLEKKASTRSVVLAAVFASLASLTRPTGFLLFASLLLFLSYKTLKGKINLFKSIKKYFIPAFLVYFIIISPWLVYSSIHSNKVLFTTTSTYGTGLFIGNNPLTEGIFPWVDLDVEDIYIEKLLIRNNITTYHGAIEREDFLRGLAVDYIKKNPFTFFKMSVKKLFAFYSPLIISLGRGDIAFDEVERKFYIENFRLGAINIIYLPFMLLLILGFVGYLIYSRKNFKTIVLILLLMFTLVHMVYFSDTKHRFPFDPLLIVYSAVGFYEILKRKLKGFS